MLGLDPSIVEHHINTWHDVAPVHQKQRPIHPSKVVVVKAEIKKLRTTGFIYPIAYTTWVSNPVSVNKKYGTIRICTELYDIKGAYTLIDFHGKLLENPRNGFYLNRFYA